MSIEKGQFLLKVLAGPHQGAELLLNQDQVVIGSSLQADILLSESVVRPEHIQLQLGADGVLITALHPGVWIAGTELAADQAQPLKSFDLITLGSTRMAIGPAQEAWPEDIFQRAQAVGSVEALPAAVSQAGEAAQVPPSTLAGRLASRLRGFSDATVYRAGALALLTLVFLGQLIWVFREKKEVPKDVSSPVAPSAEGLVNQFKGRYPSLEAQNQGRSLQAYVERFEEKLQLEKALREAGWSAAINIFTPESLLSNCQDVLQSLKLGYLKAQPLASPGEVALKGYVGNPAIADSLEADLLRPGTGIERLDRSDLLVGRAGAEWVLSVLAQQGLDDKLEVAPQPYEIKIVGYLSEKQAAEWQTAQKNLSERFGSALPLATQVVLLEDKVFLKWVLGDPLDSINGGSSYWLSLQNGQQLFPGAILNQGYQLKSVSLNSFTLRKGKTELVFSLL